MTLAWVAQELAMGRRGYVAHLLKGKRKSANIKGDTFVSRFYLPVIDSVLAILLVCKAKVESWTDDEVADKLSAIIVPFLRTVMP